MRIAILTSGRFHVCDLARELDAQGHDVSFYSLVPSRVTRRYKLPDHCNHWLGPYVAPLFGMARMGRATALESRSSSWLAKALDKVAARVIGKCDAFIGMSGMCLQTIDAIRRKYKAKIFLERGSRHILSQREILDQMPGQRMDVSAVSQWVIDRELAEYELADKIVIPSMHVEQSFVERGVHRGKLFRNPYGVDLQMFPPTKAPELNAPLQIIMTGTWSMRKGCDLLIKAWRGLEGVRLVHVGSVADAELPQDPGFEHFDPVDQSQLTKFYGQSHAFALASREEGLALVQAQALASGLPVVCTDRTGGEDLRQLIDTPEAVSVVPNGDVVALREALGRALERSRRVTGIRDLLGASREKLSWRAYGERYHQALVS